ncbi:uncharacterized protein UBRO_20165 [Ustilago bromivora]|uniref:Uncharacterized protein n=1 Tax=Ustilago bromivora TaxID=307758 RepID=A0A1K0GCV3_9BASI|nr:uncharacterized protein UBRO_20165 [Ustilago bromivora]
MASEKAPFSGITTPPSSFVATTKLSKQAAFLLWNGLAPTTHSHSTKICSDFATFISTMSCSPQPFPAMVLALIKWAAHYHEHAETYHMVKHSITVLRSWHVDLGLSTSAFSSDCLARAIQGFKHSAGNPAPTAKLPIMLPLLRQLVDSLPSFTWETPSSPPLLTVGSVEFMEDESYTTVFLPSCKTDPFGTGVTLTAPVVPLTTCAVKALKACGIPPKGYSGHSFQHGTTTWAAANGTDSNMIQGLGCWRSDCF